MGEHCETRCTGGVANRTTSKYFVNLNNQKGDAILPGKSRVKHELFKNLDKNVGVLNWLGKEGAPFASLRVVICGQNLKI